MQCTMMLAAWIKRLFGESRPTRRAVSLPPPVLRMYQIDVHMAYLAPLPDPQTGLLGFYIRIVPL